MAKLYLHIHFSFVVQAVWHLKLSGVPYSMLCRLCCKPINMCLNYLKLTGSLNINICALLSIVTYTCLITFIRPIVEHSCLWWSVKVNQLVVCECLMCGVGAPSLSSLLLWYQLFPSLLNSCSMINCRYLITVPQVMFKFLQ